MSNSLQSSPKEVEEMQVADKDLFVFADDCVSQRCSKSDACDDSKCRLCKHCLADEDIDVLRSAYLVITVTTRLRDKFNFSLFNLKVVGITWPVFS